MIAEGELPVTDSCIRCGDVKEPKRINVELQCERYMARSHGGFRFLILPIPFIHFMWWREKEWVEIRGRDTDVPTPICLCEECRLPIRAKKNSTYLYLAATILAVSVFVGYLALWAGIGLAASGLILIGWQKRLSFNRRQFALKALLGKVPVYQQVLQRYPRAFVVVPE
jgi:hypothetical protein